MKTTEVNNTEILEMMQMLMNEGMQGFPTVMQAMDEELEAWRNRPIGEVKVLFVDATYPLAALSDASSTERSGPHHEGASFRHSRMLHLL